LSNVLNLEASLLIIKCTTKTWTKCYYWLFKRNRYHLSLLYHFSRLFLISFLFLWSFIVLFPSLSCSWEIIPAAWHLQPHWMSDSYCLYFIVSFVILLVLSSFWSNLSLPLFLIMCLCRVNCLRSLILVTLLVSGIFSSIFLGRREKIYFFTLLVLSSVFRDFHSLFSRFSIPLGISI